MIDISKLSPAPWRDVVNPFGVPPDGTEGVFVIDSSGCWIVTIGHHPVWTAMNAHRRANAAFIALARNAFNGDKEALAWWEANRVK